MSRKLMDFLLDLGSDVNKLDGFRSHPADAMNQAGLSDQEKQAVLSGDPNRVTALFPTDAVGSGMEFTFTFVLVFKL